MDRVPAASPVKGRGLDFEDTAPPLWVCALGGDGLCIHANICMHMHVGI